ncbi:MAG: hypothetical protein ACTSPB_16835 [Candidatus Thorarchaeota archaeon]
MKISFHYRTQNEYKRVSDLVREINVDTRVLRRWDSSDAMSLTSKHIESNGKFNTNIPKSRSGDKQYIGVVRGNKHILDKAKIDIYDKLNEIDIILVPKLPTVPKYDGETSSCKFTLTGFTQFRTLTSVFNTKFGYGNWKIKGEGVKNLQKVLKNYESYDDGRTVTLGNAPSFYRKKYPNGVEVMITVNEPDANIEKHLFKVKLKV